MICELLFPSSILAVKLNRKTLVIVLETEIYIYDISNMRLLHVIETTPNPEGGLCLRTRRVLSSIDGRFLQPYALSLHLQMHRILHIPLLCPLPPLRSPCSRRLPKQPPLQ